MKNNIDYYPHKAESHRHPKFKMLRASFNTIADGWAAEGRFWALNNIIALSADCILDLSKKRNIGVYAEELGLTVEEFSGLIGIFSGEDIELLTEVSDGCYTTDTVQETYNAVLKDREKAKDRYKKSVKITTSGENNNFSGENFKTSGEAGYKVNESEVNKMKLNEKEVKGKEGDSLSTFFSNETFSEEPTTSELDFVHDLYTIHTKIHDPNFETHLKPVAQLLTQIPEAMTKSDLELCIKEAFAKLNPSMGVKVGFLLSNIQAKITAKHEEILDKRKKKELAEAEKHRKEAEKRENSERFEFDKEDFLQCKSYFENNQVMFNMTEKAEIFRFLKENKVKEAMKLIKQKIEAAELV
ncbi:MAG: hypothetical protein PHX51_07055 [Clostridia bacterium]|nr:hypothetical protein [Clostridia bacterium]